jgi:hypothetical protein
MVVEKTYNIIFNSAQSDFQNVRNNEFTVNLYNSITFPAEALSVEVALYSANIWNSNPNILDGTGGTITNNKLYIAYDDGLGGGVVNYVITLPNGLYSVDGLSSTISLEIEALGLPADLITFIADSSTQKITIRYNYALTQIDFTQADTFRVILGYNSRLSPLAPSAIGTLDQADNVANFNQINGWLILAPDLLRDGIPVNSTASAVLGQVPINASPNSLVNFEPSNLNFINCDHLRKARISNLTFKVTNELLQDIINVESWQFSVIFRYTLSEKHCVNANGQ